MHAEGSPHEGKNDSLRKIKNQIRIVNPMAFDNDETCANAKNELVRKPINNRYHSHTTYSPRTLYLVLRTLSQQTRGSQLATHSYFALSLPSS